MCIRFLGFVLLIWFPGVLHAQDATQSCVAPRLDGGFFSPRQDTYSHGMKLTYTCENGRKPTVKGWWATSTCQNSKWSHEPRCIDEKACFAPTIPNANYAKNQDGWYANEVKIRITCDAGYESKNNDVTAVCWNGAWSSVPVCEKSPLACGEPPQIPHAVIIHQGYQEVFAADSEVQYECEDGYTVEGAENKKNIFCISGAWTEGPTCRSSTSSVLNGRDNKPLLTTISHCGPYPDVPNSVAVKENEYVLKYQCKKYYKHVGPGTVMCHSNGSWSEPPVCKDAFCVLNPGLYVGNGVRLAAAVYIQEGEAKHLQCIWDYHTSIAWCTDGKITLTRCCQQYYHDNGRCGIYTHLM